MSSRQIILDTETTGLQVEEGHRIIEIACLEMIDRKKTGKYLHQYINPERDIEAGALAVHGITSDFLRNKPTFSVIANELIDFISGAELIIHNAPFDVSFLNHELMLTRQGWKTLRDYCSIIDTLQLARQLHVGQRNNLDALCKRYRIDNSKRDLHGALLDANLLAQVYLAMTGGQGSFFESMHHDQLAGSHKHTEVENAQLAKHDLIVLKANNEELAEHELYLKNMVHHGKCLWNDD